jgi:hypothetical protein
MAQVPSSVCGIGLERVEIKKNGEMYPYFIKHVSHVQLYVLQFWECRKISRYTLGCKLLYKKIFLNIKCHYNFTSWWYIEQSSKSV